MQQLSPLFYRNEQTPFVWEELHMQTPQEKKRKSEKGKEKRKEGRVREGEK